jgi:hypothetical protein
MTARRSIALAAGAAALALLSLVAVQGLALGPKAKLRLAQLAYVGGNAVPRRTALQRLAWEIDKRTSIDVEMEPATLRVSDRGLFSHPLLYLGGDSAFEPFSDAEVRRLAHHLVFGGMLIVDSADAQPGGGFDRSVRRLMRRLFPDRPLAKIPRAHTLYQSFYLLTAFVGRVGAVPDLEGVERDGRYLVVYSQNDLAGAWARDNFGQWEYGVHPGWEKQRELAFRWGINLVMYALCLDYKADQVHIPFILKRRRWQVGK